jgi:hypothetical protein
MAPTCMADGSRPYRRAKNFDAGPLPPTIAGRRNQNRPEPNLRSPSTPYDLLTYPQAVRSFGEFGARRDGKQRDLEIAVITIQCGFFGHRFVRHVMPQRSWPREGPLRENYAGSLSHRTFDMRGRMAFVFPIEPGFINRNIVLGGEIAKQYFSWRRRGARTSSFSFLPRRRRPVEPDRIRRLPGTRFPSALSGWSRRRRTVSSCPRA